MTDGPVLAFDSAPWIHWVEQNPDFLPSVAPLVEAVIEKRQTAVTSVLSLLEALTETFRTGNEIRSRRYRSAFEGTEGLTVIDVDREIAVQAARLRVRYSLRTSDAIHVATAIAARAAAFVTTDRRLSVVREIEVRVLRPLRPPRDR